MLPLLYTQPNLGLLNELPPEVLSCVINALSFGNIAKMANVNSSLTNVLYDFIVNDHAAVLPCIRALLDGTDGLVENPAVALQFMDEVVANYGIDTINSLQVQNEEEFCQLLVLRAMCYLEQKVVDNKKTEDECRTVGLQYLEEAASKFNCISAAHQLGVLYETGEYGVELEPVMSSKWFKFAAELGHVESMAEYALHCELGVGVEQSDEEALEWYLKAAEAGHLTAMFSVGEYHEEARGVPQSDSEACLWYYRSAVKGCEDSKKALKRLREVARIVLPGFELLLHS